MPKVQMPFFGNVKEYKANANTQSLKDKITKL